MTLNRPYNQETLPDASTVTGPFEVSLNIWVGNNKASSVSVPWVVDFDTNAGTVVLCRQVGKWAPGLYSRGGDAGWQLCLPYGVLSSLGMSGAAAVDLVVGDWASYVMPAGAVVYLNAARQPIGAAPTDPAGGVVVVVDPVDVQAESAQAVEEHNIDPATHPDIRQLVAENLHLLAMGALPVILS